MPDIDWKAIDRATEEAERCSSVSVDEVAMIIDPHAFLPDNSNDDLIGEMVRQDMDLARSKARRILALLR